MPELVCSQDGLPMYLAEGSDDAEELPLVGDAPNAIRAAEMKTSFGRPTR